MSAIRSIARHILMTLPMLGIVLAAHAETYPSGVIRIQPDRGRRLTSLAALSHRNSSKPKAGGWLWRISQVRFKPSECPTYSSNRRTATRFIP